MSELQLIESALENAARRRRWQRALRGLWLGLLAGAIGTFVLIGLYHVLPLPIGVVLAATLLPLPCMLAGLLIGGWRKPALKETARWVEGKQHLQERLSTALEFAGDDRAGRWRDLVVTDAAEHLKTFDPRDLVAFRLPSRAVRWTVIILAVTFGLGFVPEYRSKAYLQKKTDQQNIKEVGRQLADLTRRDLQKRPPALPPTEKALEAVAELGDRLDKQALTRGEALKDLANAADKLKDQMKEMEKNPDLHRMEEAARSPGGSDGQNADGLQKQMEALQKQMGSPTGDPDTLDKLQKQMDKLQAAAQATANDSSPAGQAARQKMSESLSALSKQMQDAGVNLPQLDDAIAALAANQPGMFLKNLQAASTDLQKTRDMAKQMAQMQQQMEKMGKDLAEQLKNGQAEAAQSTLQKMIDQLKSSGLSKDQLQKLADDAAKAVDPAGKYGKVADHLKSATAQMQSDDKAGAAQSLADAKKELDQLMQQMNDANQLADAMAKLDQASKCIGTGQHWGMGQCQNPAMGTKPGGKPGSGVGTWADEKGGWMYDGQWSKRWDNTGVTRPDQKPRGLADRGDGKLSDALKPDKVKGQFQPGAAMPSITLKGVSIKGQSKVAYEEAATTAQADAQSALSQEKVPRAYQGAVKDYFDDLKQ